MSQIGEGGLGVVHRLHSFRLAGTPGDFAYKELKASLTTEERDGAVRSMVASVGIRESLSATERADLDEFTTWPVAIVEDRGSPIGLLMPLLPPEFFVPVRPPGGGPDSVVFELAFLSASDAYVAAMGLDRSTASDELVRLALAAQLVYAVARLHKHGIVYGDLSLRNAAISLNPPRVKLLDCDAAARISDGDRKQAHSPFFAPPENKQGGGQKRQDVKTDVYKLGLCILRTQVWGKGATQLHDPTALNGILDAEGIDLVSRALAVDRDQRPTARDLFRHLQRTLLERAQPPVLSSASLSRALVLRGQDVIVRWKATGATSLRIISPDGGVVDVGTPSAYPRGYAITPSSAGDIILEAENAHGVDSLVAGTVDVFELPSFSLPESLLPHPTVPKLPGVTSLSAPLPPRPMVSVENHAVPKVAAPSMDAVLEAMKAPLALVTPLERLESATGETTAAIRDVLTRTDFPFGAHFGPTLENATSSAGQQIQQLVERFKLPQFPRK